MSLTQLDHAGIVGATDSAAAGVAISPDHPVVIFGWLAAGLIVATGFGPWVSKSLGILFPAFAIVRTSRRDSPGTGPLIQRPRWYG